MAKAPDPNRLFPDPIRGWEKVSPQYTSQAKGYYHFTTRDSFDNYLSALKPFSHPITMSTSLAYMETEQVQTADELVSLTDGPIRFLSLHIGPVSVHVDNRRRPGYIFIGASAQPEGSVDLANRIQAITKRFVRRIPWWKPWRLASRAVVTKVKASERRDVNWRIGTAVISGLLGFIGGIAAKVLFPGH